MPAMAPPHHSPRGANEYVTHHEDFLERFTQREKQKRVKKKPPPLNAAQRAALREQLKEVHFLKPDYADNTKINIAGILRKWKRCETPFVERSFADLLPGTANPPNWETGRP